MDAIEEVSRVDVSEVWGYCQLHAEWYLWYVLHCVVFHHLHIRMYICAARTSMYSCCFLCPQEVGGRLLQISGVS